MYYVDIDRLKRELKQKNWGEKELGAIWRISPHRVGAYLAQPQNISCKNMLLLKEAAGWSNGLAARIFFAKKDDAVL